jgi:hypothetical protein
LAQDQQQEIVELMRDIRALFQQANPQTVRAFFQLFQQDVSPVAPQAVLPVQQVDPNERRQRIAQVSILALIVKSVLDIDKIRLLSAY